MMLVHTPDFVSFSEVPLLQSFTSAKHRPNLLILCDNAAPGAVISQLQDLCAPPFHRIALPGPLDLPAICQGTLLLNDVSELTLAQQIALYDWIGQGRRDVQIVSVTRAPLPSFVPDGRFLECLFYRLNTVFVVATGGPVHRRDRRAPAQTPAAGEFRG
jgi:Sigma-54 interaction domain